MKSSKSLFLSCILANLLLVGCAPISNDTQSSLSVPEVGQSTSFTIESRSGLIIHKGTTLSSVQLQSRAGLFSGASYQVMFSKDGFAPVAVTLGSMKDGWSVGDVLAGGFTGMLVVNPETGEMWELPVNESMVLERRVARSDVEGLIQVASLDDLPEEVKSRLIPLG
ncbi:hypothetical protein [Endozoicomonas arenosclerae]|uniref:hypothetical protein n=1 Tax=Endozoicomonas arenosclerae TaxID=1633495 RepID=UPI000B2B7AF7|nr:hypothetical protein [Endozoicomonas arenosclerae]